MQEMQELQSRDYRLRPTVSYPTLDNFLENAEDIELVKYWNNSLLNQLTSKTGWIELEIGGAISDIKHEYLFYISSQFWHKSTIPAIQSGY